MAFRFSSRRMQFIVAVYYGATLAMPLVTYTSTLRAEETDKAEEADKKDATADKEASVDKAANADGDKKKQLPWRPLFDGKTMENWKPTKFGGDGEVAIEDGSLVLGIGNSLTGVNYTGEIPHTNYEVELEAKRLKGNDFFCGFTFPVGDSHCSFIVGGWAGGIVGISSIDGHDASENETTRYMSFKSNQWYRIRVRVTDSLIQTWIDDKPIVYQRIKDRKISTRAEVDPSRPFGFSTYETRAALRKIRIRELTDEEIAE